jgi:hypothetical protein
MGSINHQQDQQPGLVKKAGECKKQIHARGGCMASVLLAGGEASQLDTRPKARVESIYSAPILEKKVLEIYII